MERRRPGRSSRRRRSGSGRRPGPRSGAGRPRSRRGRSSRGSARASRSSSGMAIPRRSSVRSARSARRMTTRPSRYLPRFLVLLDQATPLERRQQAGRRRLVQAEPPGELGHAGLAGRLPQRQQERCRPVDRADRVPVDHTESVHHSKEIAGAAIAAGPGVEGGIERAVERLEDLGLIGVALRGPRTGTTARGCRARASRRGRASRRRRRRTGRGRSCPVAVLADVLVGEHDPEHRRDAGEVVRQAAGLEDRRRPAWIALAGGA